MTEHIYRSRCHEYEGTWVPEVDSAAWVRERREAWSLMNDRPGANDVHDSPEKAQDRDRKRIELMSDVDRALEYRRLQGRVRRIHYMHGRCAMVNTIEKLRSPDLIVVNASRFRYLRREEPDLLCANCSKSFDR